MSRPTTSEREARLAREVTTRAIRRLDVLQWLLLAGTAGLAVGGGAVVAWLLSSQVDLPFRATWITTSAVIFVVSGGISLGRLLRAHRHAPERRSGIGRPGGRAGGRREGERDG